MKRFALAGMALLLAGCAGTSTNSQAPYYDDAAMKVIATGFPVNEVSPPNHFQYQRSRSKDSSRQHTSPGPSSARTSINTFAWSSGEEKSIVMTALFEQLDSGSRFLPQSSSSGYEFKGSQRFIYNERWGRYNEVAGDSAVIPQGAPECATTIDLLAVANNERRRFIGVYSEGVLCDEVNQLSRAEWEQLRQRAYNAYGIN